MALLTSQLTSMAANLERVLASADDEPETEAYACAVQEADGFSTLGALL